MTPAIARTDERELTVDPGTTPLADLRSSQDSAIVAAIARVTEEAAQPGVVAAGFDSAT